MQFLLKLKKQKDLGIENELVPASFWRLLLHVNYEFVFYREQTRSNKSETVIIHFELRSEIGMQFIHNPRIYVDDLCIGLF